MNYFAFLEGFSTVGMALVYVLMGGEWTSFLLWMYLVHFIASCFFHLYPNTCSRFFYMSMMNLIIIERGYLKTQNSWIYIFGIVSMLLEPEPHEIMILVRTGVICTQGKTTFMYMYLWMLVFMFYLYSCEFQAHGNFIMALSTCLLYHIYLVMISALEVPMYSNEITNITDGLLRYCAYLFFVSYAMIHITKKNPHRLRSFLSFLTALVLSPLSFYELYRQIQQKGRYELFYGDSSIQYFMANFYIAYIVVDTLVGMIYYPQYFTLLEGWLHHWGTCGFVYYSYYIDHPKSMFVCLYMIVEAPSILLFLSRIFYDVSFIQRIKKKLFFPMFLFFRILMPTFFVLYFYHLCDLSCCLIYGSFTSLNLYWIIRMRRR